MNIQVETRDTTEPKAAFCDRLDFDSNKNPQIINICKKFVKLYENVNLDYTPRGNVKSGLNTYYEFMNYWLYYKLVNAGCNGATINEFFEKLKQNRSSFENHTIRINNLRVIEETYFNNIHTLYQLYKNCEQLRENKGYYDKFLKELIDKYNDGLTKCFNKADNNFCNALKKFRDNYNSDKMKVSNNCKDEKCPSLPELELEHSSSDKASVIAKIGSVLIGVSNAQPRNGLSLLTSDEYSNLNDLISLQYNLRMEENEEKKNCVMLEILYEYFKYCDKHNNNWYLESFINEFIEKYYYKKENVYKQLFKDCTSTEQTNKAYCTYYNNCKTQFKNELSLIERGKDYYIKNKEEHFKKLIPDKSWVQKALDLFKDSDTMLRNSPTITSTLIAIFLCFFFLYKVLKNYIYYIYIHLKIITIISLIIVYLHLFILIL
ncbi:hypothetical protein PVIIG_06087 [Plasmodium vivax India VII]|uniref:Uncharacterized protein n=1 Tax=Plasmodium vivax India VII TaxID=1077284 RepID=A0A0J9SKG7_PLAVI|nr:hypothetical protein PVIIG_06087 [Plasmodium vivax India VII]